MKNYGMELILDLHRCNIKKFTRRHIKDFCQSLCGEIEMTPHRLVFWDWKDWLSTAMVLLGFWTPTDMTAGTSAIQFLMESNITIHTLDRLGDCYINIFSCKEFNPDMVKEKARIFFGAEIVGKAIVIQRGEA